MKKYNSKRFCASFTVEATMVLSVVFMTLALLIRHAYMEHDMVTGTMILTETVINVRESRNDELSDSYFEEIGERLGNPRLWMGEYQVEIENDAECIVGKASADGWKQEIEMKNFYPSTFLRQIEGLRSLLESGEEQDGNGD